MLRLRLKYLVIVWLLLLSHHPVYSESNLTVQAILSYQRLNFEKIRSLEFSSTSSATFNEEQMKALGSIKNICEYKFKFAFDLPKYRCDLNYEDMAGKLTSVTNAFNGQIYQRLEVENSLLTFSHSLKTDNPYEYWNPIIVPFFFAFGRNSVLDVGTLQKPEVWAGLETVAVERGSQVRNGHDCIVLDFSGSTMAEDKVTHTVFFAKDWNYFPIYWKVTLPKGIVQSEMTVLETVKVGEDPNTIWLPIRLEGKHYDEGEQGKGRPLVMIVDPNSIKVNQGVKEEVFTIPITQASMVVDADVGIVMKPESAVIRAIPSTNP